MADKPIIIDGVDVSDCNFCEWKSSDIPQCRIRLASFEPTCKGYNCHYKQLKHKEQECNKLYIQLKADEEYHKQEENALRKIIKNKEKGNIELYKENNKLKQTLVEIKNIAEENVRIADLERLNGVYRRGLAKQILQKSANVRWKATRRITNENN